MALSAKASAKETGVVVEDRSLKIFLKNFQKNIKNTQSHETKFVGLIASVVLRDVINHFEEQAGPENQWPPWSDRYRESMFKKGKGGNRLLQDTGRLRSGWIPTNFKALNESMVFFNPVEYAKTHDLGDDDRGIQQRQFAWLSSSAIRTIEKILVDYLLDIKEG